MEQYFLNNSSKELMHQMEMDSEFQKKMLKIKKIVNLKFVPTKNWEKQIKTILVTKASSKFGLIKYSCIRSQVWNQFIWLTSSQNSKKRFRSTIYAWTRKGKLLEIRTLTKLINPQITKEENDLEQSFTWKSKTRFRRRMKKWVIWRW